jgi:molybdopterin/thiamine biosynthesis adenylyltransferase
MNIERFSRNILLNEIDISGQQKICDASVLCVGCGGIAAFVLPLLVASGVKRLCIIDYDTIAISNLPRQTMFREKDIGKLKVEVAKDFLRARSSVCEIKVINGNHEFARNIIDGYDCIVDLTDSLESRLFCNKLALQMKKPLFTGAAQGFVGHVYSFANHLNDFPCYGCLFGGIKEVEQTCENSGVFSPIVEIVGGFIVSNILKYFAGISLHFSRFLFLDLLGNNRHIEMIKDLQCLCCKKL